MADDILLSSNIGCGVTLHADDICGVHTQIIKLSFGPLNTCTPVTACVGLPSNVLSVVPGTGATNLGKAIDSAVGSTDTGVLILGVHDAEATKISVAEEDYDHLHIGELGGLSVEPEQHNHLNEFDATTGWTVIGNDTLNLATTTNHLTGSNALTFDKVDGAANTVIAGIQNTITTVDMGELDLHDIVQTVVFVSSVANVDYVFVRIGTDSTNYNEWRAADDDIAAGQFTVLGLPIGLASQTGNTGNGVDWGAISYIAVGVAFDNQNNTLSGIIFDQLGIFTGSHITTQIGAEVSSSVSSPNVNVKKWGATNVTLNAGNADTGTLRVVLATDQNFTKLEDAAHSSGDAGIMAFAVRRDADTSLVGTDNDYAPLQVDVDGALKVEIFDGGDSHTVDNAGLTELAAAINSCEMDVNLKTSIALTVDLGANNDVTIDGSAVVRAEDVAHSTGDTGIMALAVRDDVPTSTAAANDYVPLLSDANGRLHVNVVMDASKVSYKGTEYAPTYKNINHSDSVFAIVAGCAVNACQSAILLSMNLIATAAVNMHITDTCCCPANLFGDSTNVVEMTCSSGFTLPFSPVGWLKSTAGDGIEMNLSSACVPVAGVAVTIVVCN